MLAELAEILGQGDSSGNNMPIRLRFPSGLEILGLPTENVYTGDWDLGPTWNYVVLADKPLLVDTGRFHMAPKLMEMMVSAGFSPNDLDAIFVTHGHEDHDGSLAELAEATDANVVAHDVYERLIRFYPEMAPADYRRNFPAGCWRCFMPREFTQKTCLNYHKRRNRLTIQTVQDGMRIYGDNCRIHHLPGHTPESIAIRIGQEAIIVGDTILPGITPWPSQEAFFEHMRPIFGSDYAAVESFFGLRAYIKSLKKLVRMEEQYETLLVLPGHRLFYNNNWNEINLKDRALELISHHIQRCADILAILSSGPQTAVEIAQAYFDEFLLKGFGILMAENEIRSHCELLVAAGDLKIPADGKFNCTGSMQFESFIQSIDSD